MLSKLEEYQKKISEWLEEGRIWFFSQSDEVRWGIVVAGILFVFFLLFLVTKKNKIQTEESPKQQEDISEIPLPIMETAPVKSKKLGKVVIRKHSLEDFQQLKSESSKKVILVVDDSEVMLIQLSRLLSKYYTVIVASNGFEALKLVHDTRPDLVLTDIEMPSDEYGNPCSGFDVLRTMQESVKFSSIPVILMTANLDIAADKGLDLGAKGFLSKPFEQDILLEQIEFLLQE